MMRRRPRATQADDQQPRLSLRQLQTVSWRRLFSYVRPYRWWLVAASFGLIISTALGLVLPLAAGQLVNAISEQTTQFQLDQVAAVLVVVVVVQALFGLVQTYALSFVGERVVTDLRIQAYSHVQRLSLNFFNNRRVGEITSRITNDVTVVQTAVTTNVATLLQSVLQFVGALALMLTVSWQLSGLALVIVPAVVLIAVVFGRWIRRISTEVQDRLADVSSVLEESIAGVRVVQSFAREPYEVGRFRTAAENTFAAALRRVRVQAIFQPLISICAWGAMVAVIWVGGRMVLQGQIRAGDLVAFLLYAGSIAGTLGSFTRLFGQLQEALGAVQRVFELIDTEPEITDHADATVLAPVQGSVVFDNVTFAYPDTDKPVLDSFDLAIQPGEVLALVGPSGAGKSTIASLVPRFYDVQQGNIRVDGHDIRDVTLHSLREQIGIVPQETMLFSGTVRDNIVYGKLDATDAEITAAAQSANAHDFIAVLPQGYDTVVGERGVKLSGGQRQRLAIARAILKDPRILILDEATSSLDSESEHLVQEAIEHLMQGRTSIIIAHRLSTIKRANRIAVITDGALVELGDHATLLAQDGLYARLYTMQFREGDTAIAELRVTNAAA